MTATWLGRTAALGLIAVLTATSVSAQNIRESINAEAARIASDQGNAKRKAAFGAAFGLIGLLVGTEIAAHTKSGSGRGEMTSGQLIGVLGAGAAGVTFGVWIGGR